MKNNNLLNKVLSYICIILFLSIFLLFVLGKVNRIGYLSDLKFLSQENGLYNYSFRISYYSKIFRNNDIYGVYINTNEVIKNNKFIEKISFSEKGSPFGSLTSFEEISEEKIDNIKYHLNITFPIFIIFIASLILFCFNTNGKKMIAYIITFFNKNSKLVFKVYLILIVSILFILVLLFLLSKINHKGTLENFELIAESKAGYVYKAKLKSKGLFSQNFIYEYSDKPLKLKNKPDYIKNYGYSIEINRMPDWYDISIGASAWNNEDETFTVSNSTSWNTYNYIIPLSVGEKYKTTIKIKKVSDNIYSGGITYYLDQANSDIYIHNTENITKEYNEYSGTIYIKDVLTNNYPHITFTYPKGVFSVNYIKIEQIETNALYIKNNDEVIITSYVNLDNDQSIKNVKYNIKLRYNLLKKIIFIFSIFFIVYLIMLNFSCKNNIYFYYNLFIKNKKVIIKIYIVFFILVVLITLISTNLYYNGYLTDYELITSSKTGYVYRAKLKSKGLFSPNFIYEYSDKPLKLKNKPDYIKNYGYNIYITTPPSIYNTEAGESWASENGFSIYDYYNTNGVWTSYSYNYIIDPSIGEEYKIEIEAKNIYGTGGRIDYFLDSANGRINIENSYNLLKSNYKICETTTKITNIDRKGFRFLSFFFPNGVTDVRYIKLEQVSDNLYLKSDDYVIFTSSILLDDTIDINIVSYKIKLKFNSIKYILAVLLLPLIMYVILFLIFFIIDSIQFLKNRLLIFYNKLKNINSYIIVILIFFTFLISPRILYKLFDRYVDKTNYEKRNFAVKPNIDIKNIDKYPKEYETYFADYIPFRNEFVKLKNIIDIKIFHNLSSKDLLLGRDNWLFLKWSPLVEDYIGNYTYTDEELITIKNNLLLVKDILENRGIDFSLMICPDKNKIYPEYMPTYIKRLHPEYNSTDELVNYLRANTDIKIIYPKKELLSFKNNELIYYRNDAHWNKLGAYIGYSELMKNINIEYKDINDIYYKKIPEAKDTPNLATMVSLSKTDLYDRDVEYELSNYSKYSYNIISNYSPIFISTVSDNINGLSIGMLRDSFTDNMLDYISKSFYRATYIGFGDSPDMFINLLSTNPDIVVFQSVERYLKYRVLYVLQSLYYPTDSFTNR